MQFRWIYIHYTFSLLLTLHLDDGHSFDLAKRRGSNASEVCTLLYIVQLQHIPTNGYIILWRQIVSTCGEEYL